MLVIMANLGGGTGGRPVRPQTFSNASHGIRPARLIDADRVIDSSQNVTDPRSEL